MHFAVAPAGSLLPAVAVGAALEAGLVAWPAAAVGPGALDADAEAGAEGAVEASAALLDEGTPEDAADFNPFCTPPWPLQAPRPVAVEVVPSLQVVGAGASAARLDSENAAMINEAATNPTRL
ncbi:MAG TPA: hypothetical protein VHZ53_08485 [Steroidobacteraceae bacterium]|nr:hypothetical protein [Steroidobacteraceae bacterium]